MSRRHFGTDGVRGVANEGLTPEFAFSLGRATGAWMLQSGLRPRAAMGRDTRRSGPMIGAAMGAGLCSVGVDVVAMGVVPTGCVSFVARTGDYGLGIVVSASHNPAPDNGIKLLGHDGRKLPDSSEEQIEAILDLDAPHPTGKDVGLLSTDHKEIERYTAFLLALVPEGLDGLKVAVDAAHGAAYELGPQVLQALGAHVVSVGTSPDGMNINADGGATKPDVVQALTQACGADIGIAFDGDADRAVFSDDKGRLINGDRTMAAWCTHQNRNGGLQPPIVVGTVMSNGGFESYLREIGIRLERTPVGDKHVSARLSETGARVGGEQSGHIIFPERGPTGDGLVTALELLRVIKKEGRPASELYGDFENWPQVLINVSVVDQRNWEQNGQVSDAISQTTAELGAHGRVVVRASGTQPMLRVMVEADDVASRNRAAERIVCALEAALDGKIYSRVDLTNALGD